MRKRHPEKLDDDLESPSQPGSLLEGSAESVAPSQNSSGTGNKRQRKEATVQLLKRLVSSKHMKVQALLKQKRNLQQTVRRQKARIQRLEGQLAEKKQSQKDAQSLEVTRFSDARGLQGKHGSWFTPAGTGAISLAATCHL